MGTPHTRIEEMKESLSRFRFATIPEWMRSAKYYDDNPPTKGATIAEQLRELADEVSGECIINRQRADFLLLAAATRLEEAHESWLHGQCQRLHAILAIFGPAS